ncbi:hypothetical protein [Marinimicrobium sp. ABcell2]|uniref:hypothetical protein n=1 Tax=Marinimicrobium sp. ABcell2 TaxID=3069751 RepID=UPI0027AE9B1B|nr:hypothetical protein [Marinimicrobium sp. ABcell2]MDQ2075575.1 hypothetical protein [Marinimicrobium sp. ABcell2]
MNIWILATLIGVIAMAFGPVMMLQPSRAERRQADLRNRAMKRGIKVSIGALPRQATDLDAPEQMAIYRLPKHHTRVPERRWLLVRAAYDHEQHFLQRWAWQDSGRPDPAEMDCLEQCVPELPTSVLGIGADSDGWYCYWTESREAGELEQLCEMLTALSKAHAGL